MKGDNFVIIHHIENGTFPWYEINLLGNNEYKIQVLINNYIIKDDKGNFKVMSDKNFEEEYEIIC